MQEYLFFVVYRAEINFVYFEKCVCVNIFQGHLSFFPLVSTLWLLIIATPLDGSI